MEQLNDIDKTLNHLFRQESGKMVSVLVKIFGSENFEMAEDVVQDSLVKALETWKFKGMPENPRAWLYRTAKNKAIDILRRNKHSNRIDFSAPEKQLLVSEYTLTNTMDNFWSEDEIKDDFLGMMYACCHPDLSSENQITFILKTLCGFSTTEVANSFLTSEDTISKRVYRTKEFFRNNKLRPEIPSGDQLESRTKVVLNAIYLMFNEGYSSTHSEKLIREDLISHALYLCKNLIDNPQTERSEGYALMSLMCLHAARSDARVDSNGQLVVLSKQDRSIWNSELINHGKRYLTKAGKENIYSTYHLEAVIALQHCMAAKFEDTNWEVILQCYDAMYEISKDPIVALNRCLVVSEKDGAKEALKQLRLLGDDKILQKYHLYHASLGSMYSRLKKYELASSSIKKAISLTNSQGEKQLLQKRLEQLPQ